ncbi:hypothetical protein OZX74_00465 [Bifidobacterium sp. ESL0798]|uniref:hypothetical protein n=1 Tax=Bifidobacterium sp. ESL0798 TaxID=2983235 RepID=UPI0023F778DD|nr:hypothetical protein [Bifidobacterium sp. ESL0798]WEV74085.1 hypothetical protein OZX74_00465 [Bifidobacterium sp. ESL0798]
MKEDSGHHGNQGNASLRQSGDASRADSGLRSGDARSNSRPENAHTYNVNELRRHGSESSRIGRHRKSFIISAIVVIVVLILIAVALLISLKTLKHNTSSSSEDNTSKTVQGKTKAPENDANQMKQGIEQFAGTCTGGWMDVDIASQLPGVGTASFCKATQVAFVTFQTKAAASMDGDMVRSQAPNLISRYAGDKIDQNDLRVLSNDQWMAVGKKDAMTALQQQWGGKLEEIGSGDSDK